MVLTEQTNGERRLLPVCLLVPFAHQLAGGRLAIGSYEAPRAGARMSQKREEGDVKEEEEEAN